MSVIFPKEPAKVIIHPLPKNAERITYRVSDTLILSAWMPDGFHNISQESTLSNDDFYEAFCDNCSRNCNSFLNEYYDEEDDYIDYDHPDLHDHCNVYDNGYHGQYCPKEYSRTNSVNFDIANMVFEIHLTHLGKIPRFVYRKDSAYLQASKFDEYGNLVATKPEMASNVFGDADYPEGICWGYNQRPRNLREISTFYCSTPFNNDLCTLEDFQDNCREIRYKISRNSYSDEYLYSDETVLGSDIDAVMILDAEENIQGFYTMLMAGFKPIPKEPHVMLIPLKEDEFEKNGHVYKGYVTIADAVGKSWFISPLPENHDEHYDYHRDYGLLVGQI